MISFTKNILANNLFLAKASTKSSYKNWVYLSSIATGPYCTMQYTVFIRKYSANCVNSSNLRKKCLKYGQNGFDLANIYHTKKKLEKNGTGFRDNLFRSLVVFTLISHVFTIYYYSFGFLWVKCVILYVYYHPLFHASIFVRVQAIIN